LVVHPASAIDVLRNLKSAIDDDLLLQDGFYSIPNLEDVFAAQKTRWFGSDLLVECPGVQLELTHGTLEAKEGDKSSGKKFGGGWLVGDLTVDQVISLFGKPQAVIDSYAQEKPPHFSALSPKTHELGNLTVQYSAAREKTEIRFSCLVNGDGKINRCNFGSMER
jgi:hypothetical protein